MDKRKVITAYRRGFLTIQECAQILGIESSQAAAMADDQQRTDRMRLFPHPMNG